MIIEKILVDGIWKDGLYKYRNDEADTPIVACTFGDDNHRVYHLDSLHRIVESMWNTKDGVWTHHILEKDANPDSKLAVFAFTDGKNPAIVDIPLYLQDEQGGKSISEYAFDFGSGWTANSSILPVK